MALRDIVLSWLAGPAPRSSYQGDGPGVLFSTPQEIAEVLRTGATGGNNAMRVAAVYACVRLISGAVANMPLDIKRRIDDKTRADASDTSLWRVIRRRPNQWQKPAQFRRMMQAHVLLRGNAYARIVWGTRGDVQALIPLHPDCVEVEQNADLTLKYTWTRKDGGRAVFEQKDVLHLLGMTLDGIKGVTPITYARETIGLSIAMEEHGTSVFKNGARVSGVLRHPKTLSDPAREHLKASLEDFRLGGAREGKDILLEEGMEYTKMAMTAEDAQWLESRKFTRSDIAMFFGVPPSMIGDTEKSTSWGTGIEQQSQGFVTYTLEDHLTMWEEAVTVDCIQNDDTLYAKFNRNALVRGDLKARWGAYVQGLQWGVLSPDEVRALEDENPRADGEGGIYYDPPNTAGTTTQGNADEPAQAA